MYSKKINQLATNLNPQSTDLIPIGDPTTGQLKTITYSQLIATAGITSLNGLTTTSQTFAIGTSGTNFNISSVGSTHTFNFPNASATNRGLLTSADWTTFNSKQDGITLTTTGSSGAATFISNTLNIPTYTISGLGGVPTTTTLTINGTTQDLSANRTFSVGTVTSVGLSMPSAFTVTNSPVTSSGTLTVTGAGTASQYIRGDGQLGDFPEGGTGGGASVSYYLNGSVNQGTFGGNTYYEVNKTAIIGTGTDFSTATDGYIAQFITDANDPNVLLIPSGNWNLEFYFSASSGGGNPNFYVELYKYDGTNFTLIASNSTSPELIAFGTTINPYFSSLAVPETALAVTDRLAIRIYVTTSGRTITLHTENSHLCQIITTFTTGLTAINGLTKQVQYFATGSTGTDFNISSSVDTHTFNLPTASATNRGALSSSDWSAFNSKQGALTLTTIGNTGPATLISNVINIPVYNSIMDGIESGGVVSWSGTGLVFNISACVYYINGIKYQTSATTITLTAADPTNPRIDVIAVNTSNAVILVTGTAAANPVEPQVDPFTQLQLTNITVTAGSTTPSITSELIYDEDVETWTKTDTGFTSINYASTVNPYVGAKCILATSPITGTSKVTFTSPSPLNVKNYSLLKFAIKLGRVLTPDERIMLQIVYPSGSGLVKIWLNWPTYNNGAFGFDSGITSWQLITIPLSLYVDQTKNISEINLSWYYLTTSLTFNLDRIELQSSNNTAPTTTTAIGIGTKINNSTTGSVFFAGASGILQQDNTTFYWDDNNNRLGIGNNTPAHSLDVSGTGRFTGNLTANSFIKSGGTSAQYLKADGSTSTLTNPVTGTGTINELTYWTSSSAIGSLSTVTYPSLTEISYVKGVTSAIQTQINGKQGTLTLTTTGTSGAATLVGNTLNIPQYGGGGASIGGAVTSGTTGSILFINPTATLAQDNANLFWDDTNNRLGVGINVPFYTLDVNGTGRYQDNLLVSKNGNAPTSISVSNTTSGIASITNLALTSDSTSGNANFGKYSTTTTAYKIVASKDAYIYNGTTGGDIAILNDFASGAIKFAAGGSSTAHVTIGTTGLTTFATGVVYKRLNPTTTTTTSTATLTPDISAGDTFTITAQAASLSIANPTGTPVNGQKMIIRIKDNGTARAITFSGTQYRASSDLAFPTTTIVNKTLYMGFIWNSTDSKWDMLALLNNF